MPHLAIECSDNLKSVSPQAAQALLKECFAVLVAELPTQLDACRGYIDSHQNFLVADDPARAFVSVYIKVLSGRTDEVLDSTARKIFKIVQDVFKANNPDLQIDIAVEIRNLAKAYIKGI